MKANLLTTFLIITLIQSVLSARTNPNMDANSQGQLDAQLLKAIENLDTKAVETALDAGANPNSVEIEEGKNISALKKAVHILKEPDDIQIYKQTESTCLTILSLLFHQGARIKEYDNDILYWPLVTEHPAVIKLLLEKHVDPNVLIYGKSPIEMAEERARKDFVEILIKYGAKPILPEEAAQFQLIYFARHRNKSIPGHVGHIFEMERAFANGASVNKANKQGETALTAAVNFLPDSERYLTVLYLLQRGANLNLQGKTTLGDMQGAPLHIATFWHSMSERVHESIPFGVASLTERVHGFLIMEALLKAGAHVSALNEEGKTPLHIAAEYNNIMGATILLEAGAKIAPKDNNGKTPLDYAESAEMIKLLKDAGAKETP